MRSASESIKVWQKQYLTAQGNEFRQKRINRGLSMQDVCTTIGVHRNTLRAIEAGLHDYSVMSGANLFSCLGVKTVIISENLDILELWDNPSGIEQSKDILRMSDASQILRCGKEIRQFRLSHGYTIKALASCCGLHPNTLWNIEQGLVLFSMFTLHRIYYCMGVSRVTATYNRLILQD
ncbi:MAG: helix-turn-helix domain-containing protein [Spirochaetota bacterium]|jgi:transcriptional regulator with XRE-family HTH domain